MISKEKWREILLSTMLLIGGITLIIFTVWDGFRGLWFDFTVDVTCGLALWISLYYVKSRHSYHGPSVVIWWAVEVINVTGIINSGTSGTELIWWSLLPIVSYVLFGKDGTKKIVTGGLILLITSFLGLFKVIHIGFGIEELIKTTIMVTVASLIIYYYEKVAAQSRNETEEKTKIPFGSSSRYKRKS